MYDINFLNMIKDQLPAKARTLFNSIVQLWWLSPVKAIHEQARKQGIKDFEWATTTPHIGSIVQTLNNNLDPDGNQIYITDVEWVEEVYVFLDGEPYDDVTLWLDSEDISAIEGAEECYLFSDADMNTYQFIVWIPEFLNTPEMLELIAAMVDDHKYAGKAYIIQIIE